jgi:hypothetical protein
MILNDYIELKWNNSNKKLYIDKGYTYTKNGDTFIVSIEHLSHGSTFRVDVKCDYCGKAYSKSYKDYIKNKAKSTVKNDCCRKCWSNKQQDTMVYLYGEENAFYIEDFVEKKQSTLAQNYGVDSPLKSKEIVSRIKANNLEKHGVEWSSQREDVKQKVKDSNLERYGVESVLQLDEIRDKIIPSIMDKYGVPSVMMVEDIKKKAISKLFKSDKAPCSKQQKYVHDVFGGELNYQESLIFLDIAFPDDKIYVECDFRGHNLQVRLGNISENNFEKKEQKRYYLLKDDGWRMVRILSKTDKVPTSETLLLMKDIFIDHFNLNHSWIKFDLDNQLIITSDGERYFDYGKLYKL